MTVAAKERKVTEKKPEPVNIMPIVKRQFIKVGELKNADYNPLRRIADDKTKALYESMKKYGLFNPLIVTPNKTVIEGHRRLACAKRLGWTQVECSISCEHSDEVYASVNASMRKLSGNDALGVWLQQPKAVAPLAAQKFAKMQETIGRPLVKRIYKDGCTIKMYGVARQVAIGCDNVNNETIRSIVEWLLDFGAIGKLAKAMANGVSPRKILKAVQEKKPIVLKTDIE